MTATYKKTICSLLKVSAKNYDALVLESFWLWCQLHGQHPKIIQQLVANKAVFNWYMAEYKKCESDFLHIAQVIQKGDINTLRIYYKTSIECVKGVYPSALISINRKTNNFSISFLNQLILAN